MKEVLQASMIGTVNQNDYNGCNITINLTVDADEFIINELFRLFREARTANKAHARRTLKRKETSTPQSPEN